MENDSFIFCLLTSGKAGCGFQTPKRPPTVGPDTHQEADFVSGEVEVAIYSPADLILFIWVPSPSITSCFQQWPQCSESRYGKTMSLCHNCHLLSSQPTKVLLPSSQTSRFHEYLYSP